MKTLTLACAFTLSGCAMTTQTSTTAPTEHSHAARPMASALPPKYLFVPQFKDCLSTRSMGSYQAWCMQPTNPAAGFGITVSYWASEQAIAHWKAHMAHQAAQALGKSTWYTHDELRVVKVERAYGMD